jgi:hypothetical protein
MTNANDIFLSKLKEQREVLERRLATWKSKEMPAYRRTVEKKAELERNIEHLSALQVHNAAAAPGPRKQVETKSRSRRAIVQPSGKAVDPEVAKRNALIKANPNTPARELCDIFDRESVPLPEKWIEAGIKSWHMAYKNLKYRRRIDVIVSKVRGRS